MRVHSTTESVKAGELTWLAVAECALSMTLYIVIARYLHTFHYFALAIALAPLALLRTDAAANWALERYEGHSAVGVRLLLEGAEYKEWGPAVLLPYMFLVYALLVVWGLIYRNVSVVYWFLRQPLHAIRQMPKNWLRQALCIDLYSPPEIVPGEDTFKREVDIQQESGEVRRIPLSSHMPTFRKLFLGAKEPGQEWQERKMGVTLAKDGPKDWRLVAVRFAFLLLIFSPAFLVSLAYRISLKATCLVYGPFVWVAGITVGSADPLKIRLERIVKGEFEKVRRGFAAFVLLMAAIKVTLNFGWIGVAEAKREVLFESGRLVGEFLKPELWTWWEIALICDAFVTFGLFWSADAILARIGARRKGYNTRGVADTFAALTFLRGASAVAIVSYFVAVAVMQVLPNYVRL